MAVTAAITTSSPTEPRAAPTRATVPVRILDLPEETRLDDVEKRLKATHKRLRTRVLDARLAAARADPERFEEELRALELYGHDLPDGESERFDLLEEHLRSVSMSKGLERVDRRARRFCKRANARLEDVLGGLVKDCKDEDRARLRQRLLRLAGTVPAVTVADEARADELAAALHEEMPWMAPATEAAWRTMRRAAREGTPLRVGPLLLDGPPGIGKTSWAHRLAEVLGLPSVELDASKGLASFSLTGTERGWSTAQPGRPLDKMMDARLANPMVIIDEVDKIGRSLGTSAAFEPALLGLLEPESSRNWDCPFHRLKFDMSHLSWVLTSNWLALVSEPVRSRVQVLALPLPTVGQLQDFARRQATASRLPAPAAEALCEAVGQAGERWEMSLRDVGRMLARAKDLAGTPIVH